MNQIDYSIGDPTAYHQVPQIEDTVSQREGFLYCGEIKYFLVANGTKVTSDFMWVDSEQIGVYTEQTSYANVYQGFAFRAQL